MQTTMPQEVDLVCDNSDTRNYSNFHYFDYAKTWEESCCHPRSALTQDIAG